jgi:hypothetical protein
MKARRAAHDSHERDLGRAARRMLLTAMLVAVGALAQPAGAGAALSFLGPQYVDPGLAGGEPLVLADTLHRTLVYTSHEGTTHLYRPGLVTTQPTFETSYRDQVNVWTSKDNGATWQFVSFQGTGFTSDPSKNLGFSDPDLTQDLGGRIYNTGIDLANDALFSSNDGGLSWGQGTVQCHEGDRPWLAGARKDEVFLSTDTEETGHQVFQSTDGGSTCLPTPITANGKLSNGTSWTGVGKLYYDRPQDKLVEPYVTTDSNGLPTGVGADTWTRGAPAFLPGATIPSTVSAHWPAIALDSGGNLYLVWDTDDRDKANKTGCSDQNPGTGNGASGAPLPNRIMMAVSHDLGKTWSTPMTVAAPAGARALWPWVTAGDSGKVSVIWYQFDRVADPDCAPADTHTFIYDANITGADNPATAQSTMVNAAVRSIHEGGICQGGTTCVATGQDRRLGDFFTNSLDGRGCVMISSGDTERVDPLTGGPLPTSLPTIMRQSSGPPLIGAGDCAANLPNVPPASLAVNGGQPRSQQPSGSATSGRCRDRTAPVSRFARHGVHASLHHIVLSGSSRDTDIVCGHPTAHTAGVVARIRVSIGREVQHGRLCRYLAANGSFSRPRSCLRTSYVSARGTTSWHFNFVGHFPRGRYQIWVRGLDPAANIERKHRGRNFLHVFIR